MPPLLLTTLKVKGNHVMYDRGAWFLRGNHVKFARFVLLAVSEEAKTWLPGLLRRPSKTSKKYLKTWTHKTQKGRRRWHRSCLLIMWKKKTERTSGVFSRFEISLNYQFHLLSWPFFVFRSMYNKTIIRFDFCDIQNNQGLGTGKKWMRDERTPKDVCGEATRNVEWAQFVLQNCEKLHSVLYDKKKQRLEVLFSSQMWYIKSIKGWFTRIQAINYNA